jgi:4-amino-4-deoxy-L-arabinose transferase-like glycosyltransferase
MIPEALRALLLLYLVAAFCLALAYLRRRRMTLRDYALWGIFALIFPVFGPFFVIAAQPGRSAGFEARRRIRRR